jgi:hypothetical protein
VSFFDRPASVARAKVVHALWHRQRTEVLPGVAPVALLLARTDDTVVGLTDLRGYPDGVHVPASRALGSGRRPV